MSTEYRFRRILEEIIVTHFGVTFENSPGGIENIHGKFKSGYPVSQTRFEPLIFGMKDKYYSLNQSARWE
jgi:hypothetical protein